MKFLQESSLKEPLARYFTDSNDWVFMYEKVIKNVAYLVTLPCTVRRRDGFDLGKASCSYIESKC